jgi:hypothetical protein
MQRLRSCVLCNQLQLFNRASSVACMPADSAAGKAVCVRTHAMLRCMRHKLLAAAFTFQLGCPAHGRPAVEGCVDKNEEASR